MDVLSLGWGFDSLQGHKVGKVSESGRVCKLRKIPIITNITGVTGCADLY